MKKNTKKIITSSILSLLFMQMVYTIAEPMVVTAATASDGMLVTLNVTSELAITSPADSAMSPNISMSAMQSIGSTTWKVTTNSASGYILYVKQSTAAAMMGSTNSDYFTNYTESPANTPDLWGGVGAGTKEFGFSARGTADVNTTTWGTGANCGSAGVPTSTLKYRGFLSVPTDIMIATSTVATPTGGTDTEVCFAAEQVGTYAKSGVYTATVIATATTL